MESYAAVYALLMHCICWGILDQAEQQPSSPAALQVIVARKDFLGKNHRSFLLGKNHRSFLLGKNHRSFLRKNHRSFLLRKNDALESLWRISSNVRWFLKIIEHSMIFSLRLHSKKSSNVRWFSKIIDRSMIFKNYRTFDDFQKSLNVRWFSKIIERSMIF